MYSKEKLLEMLSSDNATIRYNACEWIRISPESCPEYITALQKATQDADAGVASSASLALQADVHRNMAASLNGIGKEPALQVEAPSPEPAATSLPTLAAPPAGVTSMLRDIRSWGFWSIGLGVLHFITSGTLSAPWGLLLIVVGLASFLFPSASMFVIYGVTLAWAAIYNLIGLNLTWVFFAAVQIYFSVRVFMAYRRYRKTEIDYLASEAVEPAAKKSTQRAARIFPWLGALVGVFSLGGYVVFIIALFALAIMVEGTLTLPGYVDFIDATLVNLGVLGLALGLATLWSKYRPRAVGIVAVVSGALTLLIFLALAVFARIA